MSRETLITLFTYDPKGYLEAGIAMNQILIRKTAEIRESPEDPAE